MIDAVLPGPLVDHEKALNQVKKIIAERHHYSADDKEALWVWDTLEGAKFTDRIFGVMGRSCSVA